MITPENKNFNPCHFIDFIPEICELLPKTQKRRVTAGNGLDRSAKPYLGGRWIFCGLPQKRRMRGFLIQPHFFLEKETGLYLKEKSNPCSLLPQTLSPYQRGQNAPPEERRFRITTVAARGRQRFPFQINRPVMLLSQFMVGNGLDRSEKKDSLRVGSLV